MPNFYCGQNTPTGVLAGLGQLTYSQKAFIATIITWTLSVVATVTLGVQHQWPISRWPLGLTIS